MSEDEKRKPDKSAPAQDRNRREAEILAKERALADGTLLIDGERVKFMTPDEASRVFGESSNHVVISPIPRFGPKG